MLLLREPAQAGLWMQMNPGFWCDSHVLCPFHSKHLIVNTLINAELKYNVTVYTFLRYISRIQDLNTGIMAHMYRQCLQEGVHIVTPSEAHEK